MSNCTQQYTQCQIGTSCRVKSESGASCAADTDSGHKTHWARLQFLLNVQFSIIYVWQLLFHILWTKAPTHLSYAFVRVVSDGTSDIAQCQLHFRVSGLGFVKGLNTVFVIWVVKERFRIALFSNGSYCLQIIFQHYLGGNIKLIRCMVTLFFCVQGKLNRIHVSH